MSKTVTSNLSGLLARKVSTLAKRMYKFEQQGPRPRSASVQPTPGRAPRPTARNYVQPRLWCDRPLHEPIPTDPIKWDDEEEEAEDTLVDTNRTDEADNTETVEPLETDDDTEGCPLHQVSAATEAFLTEAFTKPIPNTTRRRWRWTYGMPATDMTKCPKLDNTLRAQVPKNGKDGDRVFSRIQILLLDAVGPLAGVLEAHQAGRLTPEAAADAAAQALKFVGNTHANISTERRKRIVEHLNKDLRPLAEETDRFTTAPPLLFGKDFEKAAKEHVDSVRSIRKLQAPTGASHRSQQFFRTGCHHQAARGGCLYTGSSARGRRGRFFPYNQPKENRRDEPEPPVKPPKRPHLVDNKPEPVFVFPQLPLVMSLKLLNPTQSSTTRSLQSKGVRNISTEMASRGFPIVGRVKYFLSNWHMITQDEWVLQTIGGFRIELLQRLFQPRRPPQLTFTEKEEECMQAEIQSMIDKQAISRTEDSSESFYSQMFLVPKKDGRQRPVINLKRLNQSVKTEHFKMEGIDMLKDLLRAGDWMAKIDLKDAYFMIPIAQEDRYFLKFQWKDKTYQFNCLPFGLSSAPWVFTKTIRPVVATLREVGLRMIIYIDDILVMAETESLLKDHITAVVYLLENLGFVVNYPKSELTPTQEIEFLGFTVNSTNMELRLPGEKIKKVRTEAGKILQSQSVSALALSRPIGKMNAATQAIPMAPLYYRNLQTCL